MIFRMYSSWRDRTYQQSRQCECFEIKVNIHVVNQGTTHTKELKTSKKRKKAKTQISPHSREYCFLDGRVTNQFEESA